jgi:predicted ATP-binding protein involved in virulence
MSDLLYISNIFVRELRDLSGFNIPLLEDEKKHLIITGKNGSGKTTLLKALNDLLSFIPTQRYEQYIDLVNHVDNINEKISAGFVGASYNKEQLSKFVKMRDDMSCLNVGFNRKISDEDSKRVLVSYFGSHRSIDHSLPKGIYKVDYKEKYKPQEKINSHFIQHIVNLKAERSFARDDNEEKVVRLIDQWFDRFEKSLQDILEEPELKLIFDRKEFNFDVSIPHREIFKLSDMSDGHTAILSVLSEIIMRMEFMGSSSYELPGIVLIDEIETHLHVGLQKKILPFLTNFFPNVQFIITTHSPFVLSSIKDSVICDLQKKIITSDLSGYSYDALIESYFDSNKYSNEIIDLVSRYEKLINEDMYETAEAKDICFYLDSLPKYLNENKELGLKIKQLELEVKEKKFQKNKG